MQSTPVSHHTESRAAQHPVFPKHPRYRSFSTLGTTEIVWRVVKTEGPAPRNKRAVSVLHLRLRYIASNRGGNVVDVRGVAVAGILVSDRYLLALADLIYER